MSALGHKQTFALRKVMSALPPNADICAPSAMSAAAMSRWPAGQARKRCIEAIKKPQLEKVGKRVAHHAATLIVPSRLSTITGE